MFDLDQAIVAWRRQMIAAGFNSAETLDELESHLRDDVEQCRAGLVRARRKRSRSPSSRWDRSPLFRPNLEK